MGYALGIDLGTTFTAAAVMRGDRAEIMPLGNHAATVPTMVFLREDDRVLIGDAAERRGVAEPARLAASSSDAWATPRRSCWTAPRSPPTACSA